LKKDALLDTPVRQLFASYHMAKLVIPFLVIAFLAGCEQQQNKIRLETVQMVTLFDSDDDSHPSPKDSQWIITNRPVAQISPITVRDDSPLPLCPAIGSMHTVDGSNRTNHYSIIHIHAPETIRLGDTAVAMNGQELLERFAQNGVPTNKLIAIHDAE
jgi:hypothetical protein